MTNDDLLHFATMLKSRTGIEIDSEKDYLVQSRLADLAMRTGHASVTALLHRLRARPNSELVEQAIDAMTTNETYFFRDQTPFEHLRREMVSFAREQGQVRVWSAACSTGQEPYSVAMTWDEVKHQASPVPFSILATDLSSRCLAKAEAGIYSEFEVARGLSPQRRDRYFAREEGGFRVKPEVAQAITWKRLNLMDRLDGLGPFEIILCRNVLIYFDRATRSRILDSLAARLAPGGVLILGGAETVIGLSNATQAAPDRPGLYVRAASGGRP